MSAERSSGNANNVEKTNGLMDSEQHGKKSPVKTIIPSKVPTMLKRKAFPSKPNLSVKRRDNTINEDDEASKKRKSGRIMDHLQEHLRSRSDDEYDDSEVEDNPHALMKPIEPAVDNLGLDLTPTLQNVVSTVNLGCTLDLRKINFRTRMSEYNPSRFSGVVMRIREPHTTALIFRSGKIVVTGAKTEGEAHLASRKYGRIIQKLGFNVKFLDFKIQNIVGTFDLKFPLRVENLNQVHGQFSRYEPELFPGLIYRLVKPRVVLLIFVNGKIVLTGARNRAELREALQIMYPVLKSFRKDQESSK